jgi:hypothetical protein
MSPLVGIISYYIIVLLLHSDDTSDALPFQHVIKSFVNLWKWNCVSDEFLKFQFL